jgi:uncharacterized protein (TIGR04222 family)
MRNLAMPGHAITAAAQEPSWGLTGAQFLVCYGAALAVCLVITWAAHRPSRHTAAASAGWLPHDRYEIAYLAGGLGRLTETALLSLALDDRIRVQRSHQLEATDGLGLTGVEATVFRAVEANPASWFADVVKRMRGDAEVARIEAGLVRAELLAGPEQRRALVKPIWLILALAALGGVRIISGVLLGRPVGILFLGVGLTLFLASWLWPSRLTVTGKGEAALKALRSRPDTPGGDGQRGSVDVGVTGAGWTTMGVALFGAGILADTDLASALFGGGLGTGAHSGGGGCGGGGCGGGGCGGCCGG